MRDIKRYRKNLAQIFALLGAWIFALGYAIWGVLRGMSLFTLAIRLPILFGVVYGLLFAYFFWIMRHGVSEKESGESS